ncbi:MAG TPA: efflux RND transporter periplasmic adaptor subunit, partial [Chitinophaga sp.]
MQTILKTGLAALLFIACHNAPQPATPPPAGKDSTTESSAGITLTAAQLQAVGITLGPVLRKNLTEVVKANGQLAVPPQNKADIHALSGGMITHINVLEGQSVKRGQVLLSVENPAFIQLQQDYLTAKSGFTYVQAEYDRQMALKAADAGTGKVYQQAEAAYHAERARITGLESQLRQLGIAPATVAGGHFVQQVPVTAPISGTVGHIAVNTGAYAATGTPLLEIIDNTNIHCDLVVFEKDLFKVQIGQEVTFSLTNQNNQEIRGKIYGINKSFEDESKGIIVHAIIEGANQYHLIPGMYVTALINTGQALSDAVPADAVVQWEGKH